ncbi:MAG: hypothetical protein WCD11_27060 [Solirubrobacteraceae bacterium]
MNGTSDIDRTETCEDEGELDPRGAASLLVQTSRQARRGLDFRSARLSLFAAAVVLVGFGAVWLSVRGQHPYKGPTAAALWILLAVIVVRFVTVVAAAHRARVGVTGRSVRRLRAEGVAAGVALVAVYVFAGAMLHYGLSHAFVYGVYDVTATVIVLGTFWAARSAAREDWLGLGVSIAILLVAALSAFAGPRGLWLSDGVGFFVVLLVYSAAQAWLLGASRSGA